MSHISPLVSSSLFLPRSATLPEWYTATSVHEDWPVAIGDAPSAFFPYGCIAGDRRSLSHELFPAIDFKILYDLLRLSPRLINEYVDKNNKSVLVDRKDKHVTCKMYTRGPMAKLNKNARKMGDCRSSLTIMKDMNTWCRGVMLSTAAMLLSFNTGYVSSAVLPDNLYELPQTLDDMIFDRTAESLNHHLVADRPQFGNYIHAKRSVHFNVGVNIELTDKNAKEQIPLALEHGWFRVGRRLSGGTFATWYGFSCGRLVDLIIEHGFHVNYTDIPVIGGHVSFTHTFMAHHAFQIIPLVLGFVGSSRNLKKREQFERVVNRPELARAVWEFAVWLKVEKHYPMDPPDDETDTPPKFIISLHSKEEYDQEVNKRLKRLRKDFANKANVKRRRLRKQAEAAEAAQRADSDRSLSDEEEDQDEEDGGASSSDGDRKPAAKRAGRRLSQ